ncbi:hypothetical protein [Halobacillus sp. BBL2006]|uniref:hypothetical protein n=1 Tax=Halobacillus sp. BBL2006 TaxID=1543706 RepID=UPI0005443443|nr:hypothetical protein [Halobacillus sp. BBL2006]KHE73196.1 hypothetical protein LD39_00545 [Halobacillus sp. BBL2006]
MNFIANLIEYCFSSKKTLVYSAFSQKDYFTVISKLKAASIKYRIATTSNMSSPPGGSYNDFGTEYKVYVKKEDEEEAARAIHSKNGH